MDGLITNNLKVDEPDDDIMVGDNAMSVKRGASFLMGYDPTKDPEKPVTKASIGDAPMGEKPTENPLDGDGLTLSMGGNSAKRNNEPDTSFGGDTTIAAASNLGPNPLGPNPFGLDPMGLEALGFGTPGKTTPAPAPVKAPVPEAKKVEEPKKAEEPKKVEELKKPEEVKKPEESKKIEEPKKAEELKKPEEVKKPEEAKKPEEPKKAEEPKDTALGHIFSLSDPEMSSSMIISVSSSFGSGFSEDEPSSIEDEPVVSSENSIEEEHVSAAIETSVIKDEPIAPALDEESEDEGISETVSESVSEGISEALPLSSEGILRESSDDDDDTSVQMHFGEGTLESTLGGGESYYDYGASLEDDDDFKPLGNSVDDDEPGLSLAGLDSDDDDPMGLLSGAGIADDKADGSSDKKSQAGGAKEMDPLMALLLAGGNPFGDNQKSMAPDLSFGKEALKPKHFEPMKASGPAATAENVEANHPLGDNPFGKGIVPDFSFGKEALKPKKYVPKKTYEQSDAMVGDKEDDEDSDQSSDNDD